MYASRTTHKNQDQFTKTSFVTIGDPYVRKRVKNDRFGGKQLSTNPAKNTSGGTGYFSKTEYKNPGFQDKNGYLKSQPLDSRKLGFGTKDAHRRDEFVLNIAVEQYRERLKTEQKAFVAKARDGDDGDGGDEEAEETNPHVRQASSLFDRIHSDSHHRKVVDMRRGKHLGTMRVSSSDYGEGVEEVKDKPQFGRLTVTQEFFDKSHF